MMLYIACYLAGVLTVPLVYLVAMWLLGKADEAEHAVEGD